MKRSEVKKVMKLILFSSYSLIFDIFLMCGYQKATIK